MVELSDEEWKRKVIERDMIASAKKLGKRKNVTIVLYYKIKSLGDDKFLQIEMNTRLYELLSKCGVDFNDFSKGEKLFDEDREKFNSFIRTIKAKYQIIDKNSVYESIFGKK